MEEVIEELMELKKKTEDQLVFFYFMIIISGFFLFFILKPNNMNLYLLIIFLIAAICGLIIWLLNSSLSNHYYKTFRSKILPLSLKQLGDEITFHEEGIDEAVLDETDLFGTYTTVYTEDSLNGKIEGLKFISSDIVVNYHSGRSSVTICKGQLYIVDFNKNFRSRTIIRQVSLSKPVGMKKISLENQAFNDAFYIYSEEEQEAFYILTPHFMEKLISFSENHNGYLFFEFVNNQLFLAVHNDEDRFKIPLFTEFDINIFENQIKEIFLIKEIIEELKLNVCIFK